MRKYLSIELLIFFISFFPFSAAFSQSSAPRSSDSSIIYAQYPIRVRDTTNGAVVYISQSWLDSTRGGGGMPDLTNRNYKNDSAAMAQGNLHLGDWYRTGSVVKVVSKASSDFEFTINNSDGSANDYKMYIASDGSLLTLTVDWGDGTNTTLTGNSEYAFGHVFKPGSSYEVKISDTSFAHLQHLKLNNDPSKKIVISSINNLNALTGLVNFEAVNSSLPTADALSYPSKMTKLNLSDNMLHEFNPSASPALTSLTLTGNSIIPDTTLFLPSSISTLTMVAMKKLNGATWTSEEVNTFLTRLNYMTFNAGPKVLTLEQFNNAKPSGAGATAEASLKSKGWTITTD